MAVVALARRAVSFEVAMYRSLFRWLTRRPDVPSGAAPFASAGAVTPILWVFAFGYPFGHPGTGPVLDERRRRTAGLAAPAGEFRDGRRCVRCRFGWETFV